MRAFLRAYWENFIATMSGIVGVILWVVSAVLEGTSVAVSARVGCILGAGIASVIASYLVWKKATDDRQRLQTDIQRLQQELEEQRAHAEKAGTLADNIIRRQVEEFIRRFEEIKRRAATEAIPGHELCGVEQEVRRYLEEHLPTYPGFCARLSSVEEWRNQPFSPAEATQRCEQRLEELRKILEAHS